MRLKVEPTQTPNPANLPKHCFTHENTEKQHTRTFHHCVLACFARHAGAHVRRINYGNIPRILIYAPMLEQHVLAYARTHNLDVRAGASR